MNELMFNKATIEIDEVGKESVSYAETTLILGVMREINTDLTNKVPNYDRTRTYYLLKTRFAVDVNDKVNDSVIVKKLRKGLYLTEK